MGRFELYLAEYRLLACKEALEGLGSLLTVNGQMHFDIGFGAILGPNNVVHVQGKDFLDAFFVPDHHLQEG